MKRCTPCLKEKSKKSEIICSKWYIKSLILYITFIRWSKNKHLLFLGHHKSLRDCHYIFSVYAVLLMAYVLEKKVCVGRWGGGGVARGRSWTFSGKRPSHELKWIGTNDLNHKAILNVFLPSLYLRCHIVSLSQQEWISPFLLFTNVLSVGKHRDSDSDWFLSTIMLQGIISVKKTELNSVTHNW